MRRLDRARHQTVTRQLTCNGGEMPLVMYLAVETHHYIVQNMSVAAENEQEALIEWLIIITRVWMNGLFQPRCD